MSSDRPSESLEAVRAYFEFESTQEFRVLRRYIKLTLRKRKINKTEDDGGPWSKLLDELQEHLPLRASEKIKTEKDEVRRHLSFLAQRALQLLAKSEAKKARKAQRKLEQRLLNTMNSSQGANGYLLLGPTEDRPAGKTSGRPRTSASNQSYYPSEESHTTSEDHVSAQSHFSGRALRSRPWYAEFGYKSNESRTYLPPHKRGRNDEYSHGDMADQIKDEGEGSQVNPQKRTSDWPDIHTMPNQPMTIEGTTNHRQLHDTYTNQITAEEDDDPMIAPEEPPRGPAEVGQVALKRAICAYVLLPGESTPNVVVDFVDSETTMVELYKIVSPQIPREYYPKAIFGLRSDHVIWSVPPPLPARLTSDRQVEAWLQLYYPNPKDNVYLYVVLHERGKPLDPPPRGQLPYVTEQEHKALENTLLLGGDDLIEI